MPRLMLDIITSSSSSPAMIASARCCLVRTASATPASISSSAGMGVLISSSTGK